LWPQRSHGNINALAVTPDGIIWAGGDDGYLAYWNGIKWVNCEQWFCESHKSKKEREVRRLIESCIYKREYPDDDKDYCSDIADITVAKDGSIWAITYSGSIARWTYEIIEK